MKILILLILLTSTLFSQKLWEIELDKNIIQVELMPDGEHFIVNYGITGENKKDMKVEVRKLIDGSIEKQILTDEFRNAYIESNTEIYFTQDFKYFMLKYSNILFDVETLKPVRTFEAILDWNGESIDIGKVQFSKDNKYVFILNRGDFDGEPVAPYFTTARSSVYIFDFQTGEFIKKIFIPYCTENIEISDDGKYLQTFQGMYQYGQYANQPIAINIISTESLEIIKTFEPGTYYTSKGFINNEHVFYTRKYNSYNYDFFDIEKDSILFSNNLGIIDAMFYSDLIFTENNSYFYKFYRNKNDLSIGGFFKYDYPFFNKIDSLKNFPNVSKKMNIFNNNLFFNDGLRKIYLYNLLQLSSINRFELDSNYFMFDGSTLELMSNEFIGQTAEISVFNNLGQLVLILHEDLISLPTYEYTLSHLENGTYHIVCQLPNQNLNFNFMVVR